jgi:protoporphyrinogen oxidase
MSKKWLVVGGGFRGIVGAYLLAKRGEDVVLVERGKQLGGVLYSAEWNGFYLDKGCHFFDNDSDGETSLALELLQQDYQPVHVVYSSVVNGVKTEGMAIPDLGAYGENRARDMLYEIVRASSSDERECGNLREVLQARFGSTAAGYIGEAAHKMYQIDSGELNAAGFALTPFDRAKVVDDSMAAILKQSAVLDDRLAASSQDDPLKYYRDQARQFEFRNFYPAKHGMRGFCESAAWCLEQQGVQVLLNSDLEDLDLRPTEAQVVLSNGQTLTVEHVLWTAGIESMAGLLGLGDLVEQYIHRVPMVIYYYTFDKKLEGEYSYQRNYDSDDMFFTASLPGKYGPQTCPDGYSYACCEVPTMIGSPEWEDPDAFADQVWNEMTRYGVVAEGRPEKTMAFKVPVTYKMPKVGFENLTEEIRKKITDDLPIIGVEDWEFSKNDIIRHLEETLDPLV